MESSEAIDLHFYSPSNKGFDLTVDSSSTVLQLKQKLASLVKIKKEHLLIVINDEILGEEDATLEEYKIRPTLVDNTSVIN
jgi:hypothetical protein